jgi:hypothetical protein
LTDFKTSKKDSAAILRTQNHHQNSFTHLKRQKLPAHSLMSLPVIPEEQKLQMIEQKVS